MTSRSTRKLQNYNLSSLHGTAHTEKDHIEEEGLGNAPSGQQDTNDKNRRSIFVLVSLLVIVVGIVCAVWLPISLRGEDSSVAPPASNGADFAIAQTISPAPSPLLNTPPEAELVKPNLDVSTQSNDLEPMIIPTLSPVAAVPVYSKEEGITSAISTLVDTSDKISSSMQTLETTEDLSTLKPSTPPSAPPSATVQSKTTEPTNEPSTLQPLAPPSMKPITPNPTDGLSTLSPVVTINWTYR